MGKSWNLRLKMYYQFRHNDHKWDKCIFETSNQHRNYILQFFPFNTSSMTNQIHRTLDPLYTLSIQRIIKITKKQHKNFKIFKPRIFRNRRNSTTNSIKPIRRWIADLTKRSQKNCNLCAKVQPGTAAKNCENRPIYIHTPARWKRTGQRGPLSSYIFREAGALSGFSRFSPGEWWEAPSRLVSSRLVSSCIGAIALDGRLHTAGPTASAAIINVSGARASYLMHMHNAHRWPSRVLCQWGKQRSFGFECLNKWKLWSNWCWTRFFDIVYHFCWVSYEKIRTKQQRWRWPYKMCKNLFVLGSNRESTIHCPMPKLKSHGLALSMLSVIHICTALTLLGVVSRYLPYLFSIDIYRAPTV